MELFPSLSFGCIRLLPPEPIFLSHRHVLYRGSEQPPKEKNHLSWFPVTIRREAESAR
jgi:hypothetical protein